MEPERWGLEPLRFIKEALREPATGKAFELYQQEEEFLKEGLKLDEGGRLVYPEQIFAAPKKSGKTTLGAIVAVLIASFLGDDFPEVYCAANAREQAQSRVFKEAARIVRASPVLRKTAKVLRGEIVFSHNDGIIRAISSEYSTAAGANQCLTVFDELWAFDSESDQRLWDEMVPVPTRKISGRLTVTYAGFEGESKLLESLYRKGLEGERIGRWLYSQPGLLMLWAQEPIAPWQSGRWLEQMRRQMSRPSQYARMIENRWVASREDFVPVEWWDRAATGKMEPANPAMRVSVGLDASIKRDSTAIVVAAWDEAAKAVRLVTHRIFQPSPEDPLDFEATVEATVLEFKERFGQMTVYYDPYQMMSVAARLQKRGVAMREFPQSLPNLTSASQNLYDLLKGGSLLAYPSGEIREAMLHCVAVQSARGWRIAKEKASHKIDVVVALAMAALGAVRAANEVPLRSAPAAGLTLGRLYSR